MYAVTVIYNTENLQWELWLIFRQQQHQKTYIIDGHFPHVSVFLALLAEVCANLVDLLWIFLPAQHHKLRQVTLWFTAKMATGKRATEKWQQKLGYRLANFPLPFLQFLTFTAFTVKTAWNNFCHAWHRLYWQEMGSDLEKGNKDHRSVGLKDIL